MREPKTILRWLSGLAVVQSSLIFLLHLVMTEKIDSVRSSLTDGLYKSQVVSEQVDRANEAFYSLSSLPLWIFIAGIALTGVGYGLIRSIVVKTWPKPSELDHEGGE